MSIIPLSEKKIFSLNNLYLFTGEYGSMALSLSKASLQDLLALPNRRFKITRSCGTSVANTLVLYAVGRHFCQASVERWKAPDNDRHGNHVAGNFETSTRWSIYGQDSILAQKSSDSIGIAEANQG